MATVSKFPKRGPQPPARLTAEERTEWDLMVEHLAAVGMRERTNAGTLARYVRRQVRMEHLREDAAAVNAVSSKLKRMARRLDGADRRTAERSAKRLTDLWLDQMSLTVRWTRLQLAFLASHRLTQRSRLFPEE